MDIETKTEKEVIFQIEFEDTDKHIRKQKKTIIRLRENLKKITLARISGRSGEC